MMTLHSVATIVALVAVPVSCADSVACTGSSCEDGSSPEQMSILQVQSAWRCAGDGANPDSHSEGVCCSGLTKVQGQFESETCTHECFQCTGRNGNKDPYSQCGGSCSQGMCKVPCCAGTYEVLGNWNSEQCSYQCMCSGNGQHTRQFCAGGNPCAGPCYVPCCWPMVAVEVAGREVCWHYGQALSHVQGEASKARTAADAAQQAAVAATAGNVAHDKHKGASRSAARSDLLVEAAELEEQAIAAAKVADRLARDGPPRDPLEASPQSDAEAQSIKVSKHDAAATAAGPDA